MARGKRIKEYRLLQALRRWMQPPPGLGLDFTQPAGAPALAPADGVSWRVFSNPVSLFIGGVSAVLLELAEPRVRTGVWDHSKFRQDPFARLHRTGYAAMVTVYAPVAHAQTMIARVVNMHARIRGHTPDGTPYHANDPQLLNWVQATAIFGFTEAFHRYVQALPVHAKDMQLSQKARLRPACMVRTDCLLTGKPGKRCWTPQRQTWKAVRFWKSFLPSCAALPFFLRLCGRCSVSWCVQLSI